MSTSKKTIEYVAAEEAYTPDLQLMTKYQEFSAEILRLALLLLAAFGFLLKNVVIHDGGTTGFSSKLSDSKPLLIVSIVALAIAGAGALAHRYFATDGIAHEVAFCAGRRRRRLHPKTLSWRLNATTNTSECC